MSLEKIKRILSHEKFVNGDVDAIFITKPQNIIYILGFKVWSDIYILFPRDDLKNIEGKILVFLLSWEAELVRKIIEKNKDLNNFIEIVEIKTPNSVKRVINKLKLNSIGFEDDYISVKKLNNWKKIFRIPNFIEASDVISNARIIKTTKELDLIKKACEFGDIGLKAILETIEEGKTEKELAIEAEYEMCKAGADGVPYDIIVASGKNSLYPHISTSEKKIKDGDILIVDIGAKYKEYCSDMTRTFIFGRESEEERSLINLVNDGQQYALNNIRSGITGHDIDKLTRDFFIKKNKAWGKGFIHNLGHGIGIDVHEEPYLSPISKIVLKENMVVTVEPALYIPPIGGARTEDVIVIKKDGYESLSKSKKLYYD